MKTQANKKTDTMEKGSSLTNIKSAPKSVRLRKYILPPLVILILALVGTCALILFADLQDEVDEESSLIFTRVPEVFQATLDENKAIMTASIEFISTNKNLIKAFADRDRQAVLDMAKPLFKELRETHHITHFYLYDPNRICFLRVHNPTRSGDEILHITAMKAEETHKGFAGLEIGKYGTFTFRVVEPLYLDGKLVGYIELGEEIEHILADMHKTMGIEFAITINKRFLDRETWLLGMKILGREAQWNRFPSYVVVDKSIKSLPATLIDRIDAYSKENHPGGITISTNDHEYRATTIPMVDIENRVVGNMIVMRNIDIELAAINRAVMKVSLICGLAGLIIGVFFYFFLGKIEHKLNIKSAMIQENQKTTNTLLDAPGNLAMLLKPDGTALAANQVVQQELGLTSDELIGSDILELLDPELAPPRKARFNEAVRTGQPDKYTEHNNERWLINHIIPIHDAENNVTRIAVYFYDITAKKQVEGAILEGDRQFMNTFYNSIDATLLIEDGKFMDCNAKTVEMLGAKSKDEVLMTHPSELSPETQPDGRPSHEKADEMIAIALTKGTNRFEWDHRKLNGEVFPVEVTLMPVSLFGKQQLYCMWKDITEQKQAEKDRRQSELKFETLYELSGDAVMLVDNSGFIDCNQAAFKMFGCKNKEDLCGRHPGELSPEKQPCGADSMALANEQITKAIREGKNRFEWIHRKIDGTEFPTDVLLNAIELDGKVVLQSVLRDITDRKRAEDDIKIAYRKLQDVMDASRQASIIATDMNGTITLFNRGSEEMFGYSADEMVGKQTPAILHLEPEVIARSKELTEEFGRPIEGFDVLAAKAIAEGSEQREWTFVRKDGSHVNINLSVTAVRDEDGNVTGLLGVALDITAQKQAEIDIRESEAKMKTLINALPDLVWIKDEQGTFLCCNSRFQAFYGKPEEEIVGKTDYDFVDKDLADFFRQKDKEAMAAGKASVNEEVLTFANDGHTELVETIKTPMYDSNNQLIGVLGTSRNITDRKLAEENLAKSETKFRALYESTADAVMLFGLDDDTFIDCNDATVRMFGYDSKEDFCNNHPGTISPARQPAGEDSKELAEEKMAIAIRDGSCSFEWTHCRKDGTEFQADVLASVLEIDGQTVVQGVVRDITDRKRAEKELLESETQLKAIVNSIEAGVIIIDRKTYEILSVNPTAAEMIQQNAEGMLGKVCHKFICPAWEGKCPVTNLGETVHNAEKVLLKADGSKLNILKTVKPIWFQGRECLIETFVDISDRKLAEEELASEKQFTESSLNNLQDIFYVIGPDGYLWRWNKTTNNITGYSDEEIRNIKAYDFFHKDDQQKVKDAIASAWKNGEAKVEARYFTKDGYLPYEMDGALLKDQHGKPIAVCGTGRDISDLKKAEENRKIALERQQKLNVLHQFLLDPVSLDKKLKKITDEVVKIFDADFCRIWITDPGDRCETGCIHAKIIEGPHVCKYRDQCLHLMASSGRYTHIDGEVHQRVPFGCYKIGLVASGKDSKFLTNDVTHNPRVHNHEWAAELGLKAFAGYQLRPTEKETIGVLALFSKNEISQDEDALLEALGVATAQVIQAARGEEALAKSETMLRSIMNNVGIGITTIGPDMRVMSLNRQMHEWFPAANESDKPVCYHAFRNPPLKVPCNYCPAKKTLEDGDIHEATTKTPILGDLRSLKIVASPIKDSEGNIIAAIEIVDDITEQQRDEARLKKAKEDLEQINKSLEGAIAQANAFAHEAAQADKAKTEFLANMSHEIRTPMTAILGFSEQLRNPNMSPKERDEYLDIIGRNGTHLLEIINDILDISKIEAEKLTIERIPSSVVKVASDVASLMRVKTEQKGISLSVKYIGEIPETIFTDPTRLRQIMVNLIGNAIKFTEIGGIQITIRFLPQWRDNKPAMEIKVSDTGIGMSEETVNSIFNPFRQGDSSTSRKYGGTGLGLAISFNLAKLMAGDLTVESIPDKGSTFTLILPTGSVKGVNMLTEPTEGISEHQEPVSAENTAQNTLNDLRILLAEDGPDNQLLIRTILQKAGAEVEIAGNGLVAVEKVRETDKPFDLILMDIQMPEKDGYQATKEIRNMGITCPIIALTAHAMSEDREKCLAVGCNDHCAKPVNRNHLITTIARHAGRNSHDTTKVIMAEPAQASPASLTPIKSEFEHDPAIEDILNDFVAALPEKVSAMKEASANNHFSMLERLAHQMKGAGGGYGYPQLTEKATALEQAAKQQDIESTTLLLSELTQLCKAIEAGHNSETTWKESTL